MTTTRPTSLYVVEFQVFYSTLVLFFVGSRLRIKLLVRIFGLAFISFSPFMAFSIV